MRKDGIDAAAVDCGGVSLPGPDQDIDLEKQEHTTVLPVEDVNCVSLEDSINEHNPGLVTIVISDGESRTTHELLEKPMKTVESGGEQLPCVASPKKGYLSRNSSSHEQCRVCQQEKDEVLIDLGCKCRGGLAKAHRSCIDTWFRTKGSNKCEICQNVTVNVPPPEAQLGSNYWVWRIDTNFRSPDRERGCYSPLWVAFSILIGGLLLDVLISVTLGVSALPVNIIIGVIVVLGLGTALRLTLEFCHEWRMRRIVETDVNLGYHPGL
ncbi:RING/U-box superfamily protein isoform 1 [Tripterygium wilfordii]|uniref:RING/U-box superfamily protein isoform 1 n=1 Tax=Tripterygium wilfordii TaxID=458696 RepID=A0A7J7C775_TRIWF|nr:uncharacterized protein LOC119986622 [Tripterygium wilfordii]KAF5729805.1 RING/U-box superfamily protein isoform 1 [Tripterygium wilfordii]